MRAPVLLILIPAMAGCAALRRAEAPEYVFSRAILNLRLLEPVRVPELPRRAKARARRAARADRMPRGERKVRKATAPRARLEAGRTPARSRRSEPTAKTVPAAIAPTPAPAAAKGRAADLLAAARRLHGLEMKRPGDFLRHTVRVADLGLKLPAGDAPAARLLSWIRRHGSFSASARPRPGDLLFFFGTRSGEAADRGTPTLVGVVERADERGTVHFLAQLGGTVERSVVSPETPGVRRDERSGRVRNSFLRTKRTGDPAGTAYLAGELLLGFGRVE